MHALRDRLIPQFAQRIERPASGDPNTTLVIQPDHLGDIVLSSPAVRLLRESRPSMKLIAVVGPWSKEIVELAWPVDEVVTVDFPGFARSAQSNRPWAPYEQLRIEAERLRELNAGNAIVLRDDAWWAAWLARASTSELVVTAEHSLAGEFADRTVNLSSIHHITDRAWQIALESGLCNDHGFSSRPAPSIPNPEPGSADHLLENGNSSTDYAVIHPCAGAEVKHWTVSGWRAVIHDFPDVRFVVTGTGAERNYCNQIAKLFPNAVSIAGETSLVELIDLLAQSSFVCGTDNGPLHLAAALDVPTISLFGPSDHKRFAPRGATGRNDIVHAGWTCPKCGDLSPDRPEGCGCMIAIQPHMVIQSIRTMIESFDAI